MEPPLGTPLSWVEVVKNAKDPLELYEISKKKGDRFALFSAAIDDASWIEKGGAPFIQKMLQEWSRLEDAPTGTAKEIRKNISHLLPFLPETLLLYIEGSSQKVFPLLFQEGGGDWFQSLYQHYHVDAKRPIPLEGIPKRLFPFIKEFFYSEQLELLWKEEPEVIQELHAIAEKFGLKSLSKAVFRTFKNYLSEQSLMELLNKSLKERSYLFSEQILGLLNERMRGVKIVLEGRALHVTLSRFQEEVLTLKDFIETLEVDGADVPKELIQGKQLKRLVFRAEKFPSDLTEFPPPLLEFLDLSERDWAWELIGAWAPHLPHLRTLIVAKTPPLPPKTWEALEHLKGLKEFDISYQKETSPAWFDLLHATFPNLDTLRQDGI